MGMQWKAYFHDDFRIEFSDFSEGVQDTLLMHVRTIQRCGPILGRPLVDTLNGSKFSNMKELRFKEKGAVWRFAFAFDPERAAIILVGGNKRGKNQDKFYKDLILIADQRFEEHLEGLKEHTE
jgi:hypothetical protein